IEPKAKPVAVAAADPGSDTSTPRWSSHYFRYRPQPQTDAAQVMPAKAEAPKPAPEPPKKVAEEVGPAPATEAPAQTSDTNDTPMRQRGFSSHYFRKPLTREELAVKLEARVFMLVAQERRRIDPNSKPLALDIELSDVARRHSEDMANKDY